MSKCNRCGSEIGWIRSVKSGKNLPINPGFVTVVTNKGECIVGRIMHVCANTEGENNGDSSSEN